MLLPYSTVSFLGLFILSLAPLLSQIADTTRLTPIPSNVQVTLDSMNRPHITWQPISGHGSQDGLILSDSSVYAGLTHNYGTPFTNWDFGDPREYRYRPNGQGTIFHSSSGFDIVMFNSSSGPNIYRDILSVDSFTHTPIPFIPPLMGGSIPAKYDQILFFNADSTLGALDMIDVSPLGITHPDQLLWIHDPSSSITSYLVIPDNDLNSGDIAAALTFRNDRMYGEFSLTDNVIYAQGQTTYTVYRQPVGSLSFTAVGNHIMESSYTDTLPLVPQTNYQYFVSAFDLSGESLPSQSNSMSNVSFPVELTLFEATLAQTGAVTLNWATASELNNRQFVIERSGSDMSFVALDSVEGAGTTQEPQQYTYIDTDLPKGQCYYRLRQVDFDGATQYSDVRSLWINPVHSSVQVLPASSMDRLFLRGLMPFAEYQLVVYDMRGVQMLQQAIATQARPDLQVPIQAFTPGIYILQLRNMITGHQTNQKFLWR